jgi:hypothetical protein
MRSPLALKFNVREFNSKAYHPKGRVAQVL